MSATLRDLLLNSDPLYAGGAEMPCHLPHWTGGSQHDDAQPPITTIYDAGAAIARLTTEPPMRRRIPVYDYDEHTWDTIGRNLTGLTVDEQRRLNRAIVRETLLEMLAGALICGLLVLALTWIIRGAGL